MARVAKKYDVLNNEPAKNVYINSSEDIIKSQIQFYMKCEKNFLLFKDVINKFKNFFNIIEINFYFLIFQRFLQIILTFD